MTSTTLLADTPGRVKGVHRLLKMVDTAAAHMLQFSPLSVMGSLPNRRMPPPVMRALPSGRSRVAAIIVTDLPQPDSPTTRRSRPRER